MKNPLSKFSSLQVMGTVALVGTVALLVSRPVAASLPSFPGGSGGKLDGVDPRLVAVLERARQLGAKFQVVEGVRSLEAQIKAIGKGASILTSDPAKAPHVTGRAVDVWAEPDMNDWQAYLTLARLWAQASEDLGTPIRWGGAWDTLSTQVEPSQQVAAYKAWKIEKGETPFVDPGHFELRA